jgi:hypothetical protein
MTTTEERDITTSGATPESKADTKPDAAPRKPGVALSKPRSRTKTTQVKKAASHQESHVGEGRGCPQK